MEIKGTTEYSMDVFRKINSFNMMKNKPLIIINLIIEFFILFCIAAVCFFGDVSEMLSSLITLAFIACLFPFLFLIMPRIAARYSKNFSGIINNFVFNDEGLTVFSKSPTVNSQSQMNYDFFYKVYETKDCLYFYLTKNQVYPLFKKDIEDNRINDLRNLLLSKLPRKKYVIR